MFLVPLRAIFCWARKSSSKFVIIRIATNSLTNRFQLAAHHAASHQTPDEDGLTRVPGPCLGRDSHATLHTCASCVLDVAVRCGLCKLVADTCRDMHATIPKQERDRVTVSRASAYMQCPAQAARSGTWMYACSRTCTCASVATNNIFFRARTCTRARTHRRTHTHTRTHARTHSHTHIRRAR